jgi:hypothetical protein
VDEEKTGAIELVLRELQLQSHADVVVLERRDLYLDFLPLEYAGYKVRRVSSFPFDEGG